MKDISIPSTTPHQKNIIMRYTSAIVAALLGANLGLALPAESLTRAAAKLPFLGPPSPAVKAECNEALSKGPTEENWLGLMVLLGREAFSFQDFSAIPVRYQSQHRLVGSRGPGGT